MLDATDGDFDLRLGGDEDRRVQDAILLGTDKFLPIDIYVPGCPPRPEALIYGIIRLQEKITGDPSMGWRERYKAEGTEEIA